MNFTFLNEETKKLKLHKITYVVHGHFGQSRSKPKQPH